MVKHKSIFLSVTNNEVLIWCMLVQKKRPLKYLLRRLQGFALLAAGQFATRLQEFGLWGSLLDGSWPAIPLITTFLTLRDTESGQFMDCCAPANKDHVDCCPIEVPEGDLFFGIENRPDCLPFLRSKLFEHQG